MTIRRTQCQQIIAIVDTGVVETDIGRVRRTGRHQQRRTNNISIENRHD